MRNKRGLDVTEARLGLTILTCVLVAIGFYVLPLLIDSSSAPPIFLAPSAPQEASRLAVGSMADDSTNPQVAPLRGPLPATEPYSRTALRPLWLSPPAGRDGADRQRFEADDSQGFAEQSLIDSPSVGRQNDSAVPARF